jgi:hypothetical protein
VSHGFELNPGAVPGTMRPKSSALAVLAKSLNWVNRQVLWLSMLALVLTSCVLT